MSARQRQTDLLAEDLPAISLRDADDEDDAIDDTLMARTIPEKRSYVPAGFFLALTTSFCLSRLSLKIHLDLYSFFP